jgi:hypothetical protein
LGLAKVPSGCSGTSFALDLRVAIERRTQDSDVLERVLGIDADPTGEDVRTEVIELAIMPWLAGVTVSTVQLTAGGVRPRRRKSRLQR